jgi:hypothetical protein
MTDRRPLFRAERCDEEDGTHTWDVLRRPTATSDASLMQQKIRTRKEARAIAAQLNTEAARTVS